MDTEVGKLQRQQQDVIELRDRTHTGSVNAKIWMSDGENYLYPETLLAQPPSLTSICFSGGGTRALSATMGQLRAMREIGTLSGAGYISCVSGGSWASVAFTYYQSGPQSDDELLGPLTAPGDITRANLKCLPDTRLAFGASIDFQKVLFEKLGGAVDGHIDPHRVWIEAVGEVFMQPFGLYQKDIPQAFFTLDSETEDDIKSRNSNNPFVTENTFITAHPDRPFLVVNSSLLWPDNLVDPKITSFEYTPLAIGSPHAIKLRNKIIFDRKKRWVGGGLVETFAYGCGSAGNQLKDKAKGEYKLELQAPAQPFSVTDASGTSSAAYSADAAEVSTLLSPAMPYWPVTNSGNRNRETKERTTYFGDGGSLDNMGLLSMLRRGIRSALVFINTSTVIKKGYTGENWPDGKVSEIDTDFAKLFGYRPQNAAYNNRVFTQNDFVATVSALQSSSANGGPAVSWRNYQIQPNSNWGIPGGNQVFIVFFYLGRCTNWENTLATDTREWMHIGGKGQFKDFPNYQTAFENWHGLHFRLVQLKPVQINALADLTSWCCQQFLNIPEVVEGLEMHY